MAEIKKNSLSSNELERNSSTPQAIDRPPGEDRERMLEDNPNYRGGKSFRCADIGVENCNWSVTGTRESEILENAKAHADKQHDIDEDEFDRRLMDRDRGDKAA